MTAAVRAAEEVVLWVRHLYSWGLSCDWPPDIHLSPPEARQMLLIFTNGQNLHLDVRKEENKKKKKRVQKERGRGGGYWMGGLT